MQTNPKMTKAEQRDQAHTFAVICLARYRAKRIVTAQLKDKGVRVSLVRPAEITALANDYLAQHGDRLRTEAKHTIATSRHFTRWRLEPTEPK